MVLIFSNYKYYDTRSEVEFPLLHTDIGRVGIMPAVVFLMIV